MCETGPRTTPRTQLARTATLDPSSIFLPTDKPTFPRSTPQKDKEKEREDKKKAYPGCCTVLSKDRVLRSAVLVRHRLALAGHRVDHVVPVETRKVLVASLPAPLALGAVGRHRTRADLLPALVVRRRGCEVVEDTHGVGGFVGCARTGVMLSLSRV